MEDVVVPIFVCGFLFVAMPWLILHYVTQWKKAGGITREDEQLLDELHEMARRLDDRMNSIERIIAADNPGLELRRPAPDYLETKIRGEIQ
jgi:phage shock protein B